VLGLGQGEAHKVFVVQGLFHRSKLRGSDQFIERMKGSGVRIEEWGRTGE
jgi:hypothetical protein